MGVDFVMAKDPAEGFESVVDYTTVLDNFEGPLDLLLFLIKKEQIEIQDVFVSKVTEQFLDYMKGLPYIDIDKASEYLSIASTILEIKAKSLVPAIVEPEEEGEDAQTSLIRALEEYKLLKEESAKLKELETIGHYYKEPDKSVGEAKIVYRDFNLEGLLKAFTDLMLRQEARLRDENVQREIPKDVYTIPDRATYICETVSERGEVAFDELFSPHAGRNEIITTFQALLELLKYQYIKVEQAATFEKIIIKYNPDRSEDDYLGDFGEFE
mgnify:FL=1